MNAGYKTTNSIKNGGTLGLVIFLLYFLLLIFGILWLIIKWQGDKANQFLIRVYEILKVKLFFNPFYELGLEGFIDLLILIFLQLAS
jgi:hypothetical protein